MTARAGQTMLAPEGSPMAISSLGAETRRAMVLVLHRTGEPYVFPVDAGPNVPHAHWKPQGLLSQIATCSKDKTMRTLGSRCCHRHAARRQRNSRTGGPSYRVFEERSPDRRDRTLIIRRNSGPDAFRRQRRWIRRSSTCSASTTELAGRHVACAGQPDRLRRSAMDLIRRRYLLAEDLDSIVERAKKDWTFATRQENRRSAHRR